MLKKKSEMNESIQVLRGFLCITIVVYHYFYRFGQLYPTGTTHLTQLSDYMSALGPFGVFCFFVISGLFTKPQSNRSLREKILYWSKRLLSIYGVYVTAVTLIFIFSIFVGGFGKGRTANFSDYIQNLFFINQITGATSVDAAHWYIFYLFVISSILAIMGFFNQDSNLAAIFSLLLLNFCCYLITRNSSGILYTSFYLLYRMLGSKYLGMYLIGYVYRNDGFSRKNNKTIYMMIIVIIVCAECVHETFSYLIIIPFGITVTLLFYEQRIKAVPQLSLISKIGDASLSIYLVHQNVGYYFINRLNGYIGYVSSAIIVFLLMIIMGYIFYIVIERPIKQTVSRLCNITSRRRTL